MNRIKTLIHLHTDYSYDSDISLDRLARFIAEDGIECIAITDHDTIAGAQRFQNETDAKVVVGEDAKPAGLSFRTLAASVPVNFQSP